MLLCDPLKGNVPYENINPGQKWCDDTADKKKGGQKYSEAPGTISPEETTTRL